jgi:AraC-like DNA-binding protein
MSTQFIIKDKLGTEKTTRITLFKKDIRKTRPHKHNNYFEILYLSKGSGRHYIDLKKYEIQPPVMFFIRQEQVHFWELETEADGYVMIIKKSFIDKSLDNELKSLFAKISVQNCWQFRNNVTIENILKLLSEENENDEEHSFHVTEGLLKSLLTKVLQISTPAVNSGEMKSSLYHSFTGLLSNENGIKNTVKFYAEKLNTSPQNLNAACRKAAGQTASMVLSGFVMSEAKRLLLYTDNTISEIAFALQFSDPSHFGKYFKKNVGSTPKSFRTLNGYN